MADINEIKGIEIYDGDEVFYGADQHWFKKKLSAISGCGPTTAAMALAYLAEKEKMCRCIYKYSVPFQKDEFLDFMEEVRLDIKPNFGPMTDPEDFCRKCADYAKLRGVKISYGIAEKQLEAKEVFEKIAQLIDDGVLPSLLILRNPHKEINEYTWHWMTVTGYNRSTMEISVATYGKKHKMDFNKAWNQKKPFSTDVVWFYN
ncbi:MAG: hypothetical protein JXN65_10140 [Clostridia bacterium]|nr:hypothetical protein [Clostridia bacterium]